jgi:hypothetical protein
MKTSLWVLILVWNMYFLNACGGSSGGRQTHHGATHFHGKAPHL